MPQRSDVDRRARRYLAVQCVSDTGHRPADDAPPFRGTRTWVPLRDVLAALRPRPKRHADDQT